MNSAGTPSPLCPSLVAPPPTLDRTESPVRATLRRLLRATSATGNLSRPACLLPAARFAWISESLPPGSARRAPPQGPPREVPLVQRAVTGGGWAAGEPRAPAQRPQPARRASALPPADHFARAPAPQRPTSARAPASPATPRPAPRPTTAGAFSRAARLVPSAELQPSAPAQEAPCPARPAPAARHLPLVIRPCNGSLLRARPPCNNVCSWVLSPGGGRGREMAVPWCSAAGAGAAQGEAQLPSVHGASGEAGEDKPPAPALGNGTPAPSEPLTAPLSRVGSALVPRGNRTPALGSRTPACR